MTTITWKNPGTTDLPSPYAKQFNYGPLTIFAGILAAALGVVLAVLGSPGLFIFGMALLLPILAVAVDTALGMARR